MRPAIHAFFHAPTFTVSYLVADPATRAAVVIDPVLDFDARSGRTATTSADAILTRAASEGLRIALILETHAHADHMTAARHIKARSGAQVAIGAAIAQVQGTFKEIFDLPDVVPDGSAFDRLVRDGERIALGGLEIEVMATPGHTPACVSYRIGDDVFVGDTLFMPDYGTARCDFPGGDARTLYRSIRRLLALPPTTRLWMCHDYKAPGRDAFAWETTVAEQRSRNPHVRDGIDEDAFVALREARDAKLEMPALLLPSIQVNVRAGAFPPPAANGVSYLKLPLNRL
ncbi:MAG: MBL fold metallo-hydrolase [Alphaproteobacteria bacterium]|nr:MBL fold metallo-hydrolase [Alphaproteobacteria bacterium]